MAARTVAPRIRIAATGPETGTPVVLLHGLARTRASMRPMARHLASLGYRVLNTDYPSTRWPIAALANGIADRLAREAERSRARPSLVTHSLGGILARWLGKRDELAIGRVVMLAPPNHGSEVVDALGQTALFRWLNGPAGQELGTEASSVPNRMDAAPFDCGIIAGAQCRDPVCGRYPHRPCDGKVSVASTYLAGMRDHLVVDTGHTTIMAQRCVRAQTAYFLAHGRFHRLT